MLKRFFSLIKPGIIFGNVITVAGGFCLASRGQVNWGLFISTLIGLSLIVACGCVFNNVIDRDIDKLMERTKHRVVATGLISEKIALVYAVFLGVLGSCLLYWQTNLLTLLIALAGLFFYVVVYSLALKRNSVYGTLVGSISGAVPPVVGYCAVSNSFDLGALILFVILILWQMPHSYAIAIYRSSDYAAAGIPVLPLKKGIHVTKIHMLIYVIAFNLATLLLFWCGYTGAIYFIVAAVIAVIWLRLSLRGFRARDDKRWARKMFGFSIIAITLLALAMSIDTRLPHPPRLIGNR